MMHLLADSEVLSRSYFFGKPAWIPWMIGFGLILSILSLLSYRQSLMPLWSKGGAWLVRCLGISLLLLCLLEPMGVQERAKPQANAFAVLVDNSLSTRELWQARGREITALSPGSKPDQWYRDLLSDQSSWIRKLSDDYRVRRYLFAESLEPIDSFEGIQQNGTESNLLSSLAALKERYSTRDDEKTGVQTGFPLAGILVLTDGQATDRDRIDSLEALGVPVFPVVCGDIPTERDLSVTQINVRQTDFETAPITLRASIVANGMSLPNVEVDLIDDENRVVATKKATFERNKTLAVAEFQFRPMKPGAQGYRIVARDPTIQSETRIETITTEPIDHLKELTTLNNQRFQVVDRGRGPYRVLYLAGRPNWEFKFLSRALSEDEEMQLTALIRIAKKEPKFNFRDTKVDSANPLFSGFEDISAEEKEQFDQPVYVRLGMTEQGQLKAGFPKDLEELFAYQAVILDDLEHTFLSQEQQSMLRQFVAIRGGGLLALGGQESMRGKDFSTSVLSQLLPVYGQAGPIDPAEWTTDPNQEPPASVRFSLTREGWLQPFMRLADNEAAEKDRLKKMPPFHVLNRTPQIKPGASVLSEGQVGEENVPLLITQKYGRGKTAAFMLGDWWRWAMHRQDNEPSPLFQAWRQLARWLVNDVPRNIELRIETVKGSQRLRRLTVDAKGNDFQSIDNANITVKITKPNGEMLETILEPSTELPGRYESLVLCDQQGVYVATATGSAADESPIGSAQSGWVHEPLAKELQSLGEDRAFLEEIATKSGGKVLSLSDLDHFANNIPSDRVPVRERRIYPLWHQSWVIGCALLFLCIEWGWRRRYGLA